jgi:hypothetical protein
LTTHLGSQFCDTAIETIDYAWRKNVSGIVQSAAALVLGREQDGVISEGPALQIRRGDCQADFNSFSEPVCSAALVRGSAEAAMPAPSILSMSRRVNFKLSFMSFPLFQKF